MTLDTSNLLEHLGIFRWMVSSRSLLRVRARLQRELSPGYRKGFYDVWVKSHIGARRRLAHPPPGSTIPLTVKLSPTMRCNLRCKGCFAAHAPISGDLGLDLVSRLVSQARSMGTPSIGVIGGEPLLVHSLFEVFRAHRDMGFYLVTNGTLVTREVCERLQELPNVLTVVSIEGFQPTNDALRGKGVYDGVLRAMGHMRDARSSTAPTETRSSPPSSSTT
jgi:MoaA/NifB/PqqE/SkfB family radical SAM enzyme